MNFFIEFTDSYGKPHGASVAGKNIHAEADLRNVIESPLSEGGLGLDAGGWHVITEERYMETQLPTLEEARAAKLAEIVAKANEVKAALSARFSALEENTWPEQEAGARRILDDAINVKDKTARLILLDEASTTAAVDLVTHLAGVDGATLEEFASRIVANADISYQAGIAALLEQRGYEAKVHKAESVEAINSIAPPFHSNSSDSSAE